MGLGLKAGRETAPPRNSKQCIGSQIFIPGLSRRMITLAGVTGPATHEHLRRTLWFDEMFFVLKDE